jgi:DNA-binding MarR family transcriptional regulator
MKAQETVGYQVKTSWQSIAKMYNRLTNENGFSQAIGYVLINVKKEGIPVTKIAPNMGVEPTSLSRLLNTMEDKGLIYREKDKLDRRVVNLFLTEKGMALKRISKKMVVDYNNYLFAHIDPKDMEAFFRVIEQVTALTNDIQTSSSFGKRP